MALLPKDLLFVVGIRTLAPPLLVGFLAFGALVLWPDRTRESGEQAKLAPVARQGSPRGEQPPGPKTILAALVVISAAFVLWRPISPGWTVVLVVLIPVAVVIIYDVVVHTEGFAHLAATLFIATALFGGLLGVARQYEETVSGDNPSVADQRCDEKEVSEKSPGCYVQQVVGVHLDDVAKFSVGPRPFA